MVSTNPVELKGGADAGCWMLDVDVDAGCWLDAFRRMLHF